MLGRIVSSASDQPDVIVSVFAGEEAVIEGLPAGHWHWREVITTEAEGFGDGVIEVEGSQTAPVPLRARSLTTLIQEDAR